MTTMTAAPTIEDLAAEIARLSPAEDSDEASGYVGHDHGDGLPNVGWYCAGGNAGLSVFAIHEEDIATLMERLAVLPDHDFENGPALRERPEFSGLRIDFHA